MALFRNVSTGPDQTATYNAPHSGGPISRLQATSFSPVTADAITGRGADHSLMIWSLFFGSDMLSEIARSLFFRLIMN
jgi:hypothetical protein